TLQRRAMLAGPPVHHPPPPVAAHVRVVPAPEPAIVQRRIPFGPRRKAEMRAYARRHYHIDDYHLVAPKQIVEHFTATDTFAEAYDTFAADVPDPELHELPGTCAHFIVDR